MTSLVTVRDLTRSYGSVSALREVSLTFAAGSRTAVIGPSGSGKSTLLHILAGLDTGYLGTVEADPTRGRLGYAFQEHRLLPWASVRKNVAFPLEAAGWGRAETNQRVRHLLEVVGLTDVENEYPQALSGGMRQRAALARALASRPLLLLLDEPFSAVDEDQAERLCAYVRAELRSSEATLVVVTHRLREAVQLADRAVLLDHGHVARELTFGRAEPGDPDVDAAVEALLRSAVRDASAQQHGVRQ